MIICLNALHVKNARLIHQIMMISFIVSLAIILLLWSYAMEKNNSIIVRSNARCFHKTTITPGPADLRACDCGEVSIELWGDKRKSFEFLRCRYCGESSLGAYELCGVVHNWNQKNLFKLG